MLTDGRKIILDEEICEVYGLLTFQSARGLYHRLYVYQIDRQVYRNRLLAAFRRWKQIPAHPKELLLVHALEKLGPENPGYLFKKQKLV